MKNKHSRSQIKKDKVCVAEEDSWHVFNWKENQVETKDMEIKSLGTSYGTHK